MVYSSTSWTNEAKILNAAHTMRILFSNITSNLWRIYSSKSINSPLNSHRYTMNKVFSIFLCLLCIIRASLGTINQDTCSSAEV
jgi:hypothetical protein